VIDEGDLSVAELLDQLIEPRPVPKQATILHQPIAQARS
jgi:hypothetical protein